MRLMQTQVWPPKSWLPPVCNPNSTHNTMSVSQGKVFPLDFMMTAQVVAQALTLMAMGPPQTIVSWDCIRQSCAAAGKKRVPVATGQSANSRMVRKKFARCQGTRRLSHFHSYYFNTLTDT